MGNTISKFAKEGTVVKVTASNDKKKEERHSKFESKIQERNVRQGNFGSGGSELSNVHYCSSSTESFNYSLTENADELESVAYGFETQGMGESLLVHTNKVTYSAQKNLRNDAHLYSEEKSNGKSTTVDRNSEIGTIAICTNLSEENYDKQHENNEKTVAEYSAKTEKEEGRTEKQGNYEQTGQQENHGKENGFYDVYRNAFKARTNTNPPRCHTTALVSDTNVRYRCQITEKELNACDGKLFLASFKASTAISSAIAFVAKSFLYFRNRPVFQQVHVYAIGFSAEPIVLSSTYPHVIKSILLRQELRQIYLDDIHFRLATFSLSPNNFEMGVTLRLATQGYFCDVDGRLKCACRGNGERSEVANVPDLPNPNCVVQFSRERIDRTNAEYFDDIDRENFHIGGSQQVTQDVIATPDEEQCLREEATSQAQTCVSLHSPSDIRVTEVQCCRTNQDRLSQTALQDGINSYFQTISTRQEFQYENQVASLHPAENRVTGQDDPRQNNRRDVRENLFSDAGLKGKKTYVHRTRRNEDMTPRNTLLTENARLMSRTQCCICKMRRRNIVFRTCGHLVVCEQCNVNVTVCPTCRRKVDTALKVDV